MFEHLINAEMEYHAQCLRSLGEMYAGLHACDLKKAYEQSVPQALFRPEEKPDAVFDACSITQKRPEEKKAQ